MCLTKAAFAEILCDYNVSLINYSVSEIQRAAARIWVVIADTSCFILLDKIDEIHLSEKLFSSIAQKK